MRLLSFSAFFCTVTLANAAEDTEVLKSPDTNIKIEIVLKDDQLFESLMPQAKMR